MNYKRFVLLFNIIFLLILITATIFSKSHEKPHLGHGRVPVARTCSAARDPPGAGRDAVSDRTDPGGQYLRTEIGASGEPRDIPSAQDRYLHDTNSPCHQQLVAAPALNQRGEGVAPRDD